jgi:phage tail-like protein
MTTLMPDYPPSAFYFTLRIEDSTEGVDSSFQEVSGISSEIETEDVTAGDENRFSHRLPKAAKHPLLVLKRGVVVASSPLIRWCQQVLDSGLQLGIDPKVVHVYLHNEKGDPIRGWSFADAYPVRWEIDGFSSMENEIMIKTISLSYTSSNRTSY